MKTFIPNEHGRLFQPNAVSVRWLTPALARVVAANTGLPTGDQPMPEVWLRFQEDAGEELGAIIAAFIRSA